MSSTVAGSFQAVLVVVEVPHSPYLVYLPLSLSSVGLRISVFAVAAKGTVKGSVLMPSPPLSL
jgi:hypothetical protein